MGTAIALFLIGIIVIAIARAFFDIGSTVSGGGDRGTRDEAGSGHGYYSSALEARQHGAYHALDNDDDGPGHYA